MEYRRNKDGTVDGILMERRQNHMQNIEGTLKECRQNRRKNVDRTIDRTVQEVDSLSVSGPLQPLYL